MKHLRVLFIIFFFMSSVVSVFAETTSDRRVQEQKRQSLEQARSQKVINQKNFILDYGAWLDYRITHNRDDDNQKSADDFYHDFRDVDFRVWMTGAWLKDGEKRHSFYLRVKDLYSENRTEGLRWNSDHEGTKVDYAYWTFRKSPWKVEVGRKYFQIGRGLAYSNVHDGVQVNFGKAPWNLGLILTQSLPSEDSLDTSLPGFDQHHQRQFAALGLGYGGIQHHQPYLFVLLQQDQSEEDPDEIHQEYRYDSQYLGLGSKGQLSENISYWSEAIYQTGRSFRFDDNTKADIRAWAVDAGVQFTPSWVFDPEFTFAYAFGSGDADRNDVTNTINGNTRGDDESFHYFGYLDTGYALAPRLSNLHVYRAGVVFNSWSRNPLLEQMRLEVEGLWFRKDEAIGAISDIEATESSRDVGKELDVTLSWPIFSDLSCAVEYGHFWPGEAFPVTTRDSEQYLGLSLTLSF